MTSTVDPPPGLIPVPLATGGSLLLMAREYVPGIRRGTWWRRRAARRRRIEPGATGGHAPEAAEAG